jgi:hypothetical protein
VKLPSDIVDTSKPSMADIIKEQEKSRSTPTGKWGDSAMPASTVISSAAPSSSRPLPVAAPRVRVGKKVKASQSVAPTSSQVDAQSHIR